VPMKFPRHGVIHVSTSLVCPLRSRRPVSRSRAIPRTPCSESKRSAAAQVVWERELPIPVKSLGICANSPPLSHSDEDDQWGHSSSCVRVAGGGSAHLWIVYEVR